MTGPELEEVAQIITTALITHRAHRTDSRLARATHIIHSLENEGWIMIKEGSND